MKRSTWPTTGRAGAALLCAAVLIASGCADDDPDPESSRPASAFDDGADDTADAEEHGTTVTSGATAADGGSATDLAGSAALPTVPPLDAGIVELVLDRLRERGLEIDAGGDAALSGAMTGACQQVIDGVLARSSAAEIADGIAARAAASQQLDTEVVLLGVAFYLQFGSCDVHTIVHDVAEELSVR